MVKPVLIQKETQSNLESNLKIGRIVISVCVAVPAKEENAHIVRMRTVVNEQV